MGKRDQDRPLGIANPELAFQTTNNVLCLETLAATSLTVPSPGCYTFDLGQNMVGWGRLKVSGAAGTT